MNHGPKPSDLGFQTTLSSPEVQRLRLEGSLPDWLSGTLLRNGPGQFEAGPQSYRHWFDGHALIHRFHIEAGEVYYNSRFLQTLSHLSAQESGRICFSEFAADPCCSFFGKMMSVFFPSYGHNASVNILKMDDRLLAMTETPLPVEFDPETLETLGVVEYSGKKLGNHLATAHPHIDSSLGKVFNYAARISKTNQLWLTSMPQDGMLPEVIWSAQRESLPYMHSFGMSENYLILTEFPYEVKALEALMSGKPFADNLKWFPDKPCTVRVIDKRMGYEVKSFEIDAFFAFHHANAWEEGEMLHFHICANEDANIVEDLYLDCLKSDNYEIRSPARLVRFSLNLNSGQWKKKELNEIPFEMPRFHFKRGNMSPLQYIYGITLDNSQGEQWFNRLAKMNVETGEAQCWGEDDGGHIYPGEGIFIPRPHASEEDDGVVLSVALDGDKRSSFLAVLDAKSMKTIAKAEAPHPIPHGFHGNFFN